MLTRKETSVRCQPGTEGLLSTTERGSGPTVDPEEGLPSTRERGRRDRKSQPTINQGELERHFCRPGKGGEGLLSTKETGGGLLLTKETGEGLPLTRERGKGPTVDQEEGEERGVTFDQGNEDSVEVQL